MRQEDYLQQNAFHDVDCYCQIEKQYRMLKLLLLFYDNSIELLQAGEPLECILASPIRAKLSRMKESPSDDFFEEFERLLEGLNNLALS